MTLTSRLMRFLTAMLLGTALLASRGDAAPPNTISGSAAICDPWSPQHCAQPDSSGNLPVTGTFSATLGGFAPATTGTPISVTTGGVTGTLPAGAVVVATNVGTTNAAYCKLGASATTSDQYISPGGGWFAFTVGAATQLTCITSTSTTTVNMIGGAGLPTGTGGGSGSGGSGAITTWAGGTLGAMANYGTPPGAVLVPGVNAYVTGSAAGAVAGTTSTSALGSMVNCASTTSASGQTTGSQSYLNCTPTGELRITQSPVTAGGLSVYNVQPAASDNHVVIKAGAGQVYKIEAFNNSATVNYVRLYNATTGFNGCNSATNLVWQGIIPASTSGAGLSASWDSGIAFATGISICVTSGYAQTDTTNATASALVVNVGYK